MTTPTHTSSPVAAQRPAAEPSTADAPDQPRRPLWRAALARLWWLLPAGAVLALALAWATGGSGPTTYQASSTTYLGQPVGRNGSLLTTLGSNAASGIEIATGNEAARAAAEAADVTPQRVRRGLTARPVQSSLGSRQVTPPALVRVTMVDRDPEVAERVANAVAEYLEERTGEYGRTKIGDLEEELAAYESQLRELRRAQTQATGSQDAALVTVISSQAYGVQGDIADTRAELAAAKDLEQVRIMDRAAATKVGDASRTSTYLRAALLGVLLGAVAALVLAARARRSVDA